MVTLCREMCREKVLYIKCFRLNIKHSLKGAYARLVLDRYGDLDVTEVSPCTMFGDYYATILMPDMLEELCRKALLENTDLSAESKEELQELLAGIGEDDNCFVLYGKIN